jgi:hypothetical protein
MIETSQQRVQTTINQAAAIATTMAGKVVAAAAPVVAAAAEEQGQLIDLMVGSGRDDESSLMGALFWQLYGIKMSNLLAFAYLEVFQKEMDLNLVNLFGPT